MTNTCFVFRPSSFVVRHFPTFRSNQRRSAWRTSRLGVAMRVVRGTTASMPWPFHCVNRLSPSVMLTWLLTGRKPCFTASCCISGESRNCWNCSAAFLSAAVVSGPTQIE
jgi:hypothetical protein